VNTDLGAALKGRGLTARRGNQRLFPPLDFEIPAGRVTWLRGQNGSGKTTLLRIIAGLAQPDGGTLLWNEAPLSQSSDYRRSLVYIGHSSGLKDDLTALESLLFLVHLHGQPCTPAQAESALRRMGVNHRRNLLVRHLSQGQRRRVALARLVLQTEAPLWILDEPFDALDDGGINAVKSLMHECVEQGGRVLLTSHIPVVFDKLTTVEINLDQGPNAP
jgi:heme exporter protein A